MVPDDVRAVAEKAKRSGMLIYDPSYNWWYTPEHFMHAFSYAHATTEFLSRIQIKHKGMPFTITFNHKGKTYSGTVTPLRARGPDAYVLEVPGRSPVTFIQRDGKFTSEPWIGSELNAEISRAIAQGIKGTLF